MQYFILSSWVLSWCRCQWAKSVRMAGVRLVSHALKYILSAFGFNTVLINLKLKIHVFRCYFQFFRVAILASKTRDAVVEC